MKPSFQILDHPADLKIQAQGQDLKEVFLELARAMLKTLKKKIPQKVTKEREIRLSSPDIQGLLIDFLSEILCLVDVNNEIYSQIEITALTKNSLRAKLKGTKFNSLDTEIKAVTYAGGEIKKTKDGYEAVVIFDI